MQTTINNYSRSLLLARRLPLVPPLELDASNGSLLRVGLKQSSWQNFYRQTTVEFFKYELR